MRRITTTLRRDPVIWGIAVLLVLPLVVVPIALFATFGPGGAGIPSGKEAVWAIVDVLGLLAIETGWLALMLRFFSTKLYEEGVEQRQWFRRRFLGWDQVKAVRITRAGTIRLKGGRLTMVVALDKFEDRAHVVEVIDSHLAAQGGLRRLFLAGYPPGGPGTPSPPALP